MPESISLDDLPQPAEETTVHPEDLTVDGDNPNEQNDEMFGLLCENLQERGWIGNAIVADVDGTIADGEHRWRAAQEIGLEEVPVKFYDIDDAERRLWRQELNKISGEHDAKRDALEYDLLLGEGYCDDIHALTSAADEDLDELLAEIGPSNSNPAPYEYDHDHNVYFEDCVDGMTEHIDDGSVDCVVTDPPYGMDFTPDRKDSAGNTVKVWDPVKGDASLDEALDLLADVLDQVDRVLVDGGHAYFFCDWRGIDQVKPLIEQHLNVKNVLVWDKGSMGIGDLKNNWGYSHEFCIFATNGDRATPLSSSTRNVLEHPRLPRTEYVHPTEKPVPLILDLVRTSTSEGDRVLDPFMGSGSTAVAAVRSSREYVGFELDEENYRSVIERRISEAKREREADTTGED